MPHPPAGGKLSPATAAGFHDPAALRPGRSPEPKPAQLSPQTP